MIVCNKCKSKSVRVINSTNVGDTVYRRRKCENCGHIYFTVEIEKDDVKDIFFKIINDKAKEK